MNLEKIIQSIESGKTKGYSEEKIIGDNKYCFQYAIKKTDIYLAYFFSIPFELMESMDSLDDHELIEEFQTIDDAINFIKIHNGDIEKFSSFKGSKPL